MLVRLDLHTLNVLHDAACIQMSRQNAGVNTALMTNVMEIVFSLQEPSFAPLPWISLMPVIMAKRYIIDSNLGSHEKKCTAVEHSSDGFYSQKNILQHVSLVCICTIAKNTAFLLKKQLLTMQSFIYGQHYASPMAKESERLYVTYSMCSDLQLKWRMNCKDAGYVTKYRGPDRARMLLLNSCGH